MRIETLLELVQPSVTRKTTNLRFRDRDDDDPDALGQGNYSTVKSDRHDPHMVRKHHHAPLKPGRYEDGYVDFINFLIDNNIQEVNLPRVYDVKEITDPKGHKIYKYKLEKLESVKEISTEELLNIVERTLNRPYDLEPALREDHAKMELVRNLGYDLGQAISYGDYRNIKDEEMIKTLQALHEYVKSKKNIHIDLRNSGNIMFRRGPTGLQLVIIDPFA